jgi:hypothetical protein
MSLISHVDNRERPPRLKLAQTTPAVLRVASGDRVQGRLQVISVTGGLLWLSSPLDLGSRANVIFLMESGPVSGTAEMLKPISNTQQAFRFVDIGRVERSRLQKVIQFSSDQNWRDHQAIMRDRAW